MSNTALVVLGVVAMILLAFMIYVMYGSGKKPWEEDKKKEAEDRILDTLKKVL